MGADNIICGLVQRVNSSAFDVQYDVFIFKPEWVNQIITSLLQTSQGRQAPLCYAPSKLLFALLDYLFSLRHFWFATVQDVLQADWQEAWHSPQPVDASVLMQGC